MNKTLLIKHKKQSILTEETHSFNFFINGYENFPTWLAIDRAGDLEDDAQDSSLPCESKRVW